MIAALIAAALAVTRPHKPTIPAAEWKMIRQEKGWDQKYNDIYDSQERYSQ